MTDPTVSASALQFGRADEGRRYRDRPAAFGIASRADGKIAVVHVRRPGEDFFDLPGGAIEAGETETETLIREFGEETGLVVAVGVLLTRSSQYLITARDEPANNRAGHYVVTVTGEDASLKIEDDHTLEWLDAFDALQRLRHDSHAWALAAWLRSAARDS